MCFIVICLHIHTACTDLPSFFVFLISRIYYFEFMYIFLSVTWNREHVALAICIWLILLSTVFSSSVLHQMSRFPLCLSKTQLCIDIILSFHLQLKLGWLYTFIIMGMIVLVYWFYPFDYWPRSSINTLIIWEMQFSFLEKSP